MMTTTAAITKTDPLCWSHTTTTPRQSQQTTNGATRQHHRHGRKLNHHNNIRDNHRTKHHAAQPISANTTRDEMCCKTGDSNGIATPEVVCCNARYGANTQVKGRFAKSACLLSCGSGGRLASPRNLLGHKRFRALARRESWPIATVFAFGCCHTWVSHGGVTVTVEMWLFPTGLVMVSCWVNRMWDKRFRVLRACSDVLIFKGFRCPGWLSGLACSCWSGWVSRVGQQTISGVVSGE